MKGQKDISHACSQDLASTHEEATGLSHQIVAILVVTTAILAHAPALNTWWCLDDWGQLARAAGYISSPDGFPARFISQHLWWRLVWPILGLNAPFHAALRLIIHAAATLAVIRIGRKCGLCSLKQLCGGLLFAATPISFTVLFWASGIQEILAAVFSLWALERWTASGRTNVFLSGFLAICSILSKTTSSLFLTFSRFLTYLRRL